MPSRAIGEIRDIFRNAEWLHPQRIRLWEKAFAAAWVVTLLFESWYRTRHGITDKNGLFLAEDFINFWSGAKLAVAHRLSTLYDLQGYVEYLKKLVGPSFSNDSVKNYSYPPTTLLLTLPLALFTYVQAVAVWSLAGLGVCTFTLSRMTGWRAAWLAVLASPATYICLHWGQNGLFSAALMAGGVLALQRRPYLAGFLFGLLCYKPQLGILIPVALAAAKEWKAFAAAAVTATVITLASVGVFGVESWVYFRNMMGFMREYLEKAPHSGQPTVFTTIHLLLPDANWLAYAAQGVSAVFCLLFTWRVWRGNAPLGVKGAALLLATFLATPYAWNQEMIILTFAAFWIAEDAKRSGGFLPWEKTAWLFVILAPITIMPIGRLTNVGLAPVALWAALWLVVKRAEMASGKVRENKQPA